MPTPRNDSEAMVRNTKQKRNPNSVMSGGRMLGTISRKTIQRLMRMQPDIRRGLKRLQKTRPLRNRIYQRAGGMWNARVKATRLTRVAPGESFTLQITPQIVPDLRSVASFLSAK